MKIVGVPPVVAIALAILCTAASAGNPMAGRGKAQACADCHGAEGASPHPGIPNLAGQQKAYLLKELMDFKFSTKSTAFARTRIRSQSHMSPQVLTLSIDDMKILADWFANQPCPKVEASDSGPKPAKAMRCEACHGDEGRSSANFVPSLAGQKEAYLAAQLSLLRETAQGLFPADPDGLRAHSLMGPHAADLTDSEARALASWFASRACR